MAEEVGSAYVVIRAITRQLAADIKDGVEKGAANADVDKVGEDLGTKIGDETSTSAGKKFGKEIGDKLEDAVDTNDSKRGTTRVGKKLSTRIAEAFKRDKSLGKAFGDKLSGLLKGLTVPGGAIGWAVLLGLPALAGAVQIISAALVTLTSQLGNVVVAAAGLGAALIGGLGAVVLGAIPIVLAIKFKDEDVLKEALERLGNTFEAAGTASADALFPGIITAINQLGFLAPLLEEFGPQITGIVGDMLALSVGALTSSENLGFLNTAFQETVGFFEQLKGAFVAFADVLPALFSVTIPLATRLAESLREGFENFNDFVKAGAADGSLAVTLDLWYERLEVIGRILRDLTLGLFNFFTAGAESSDSMFQSLEGIAARFREFTASAEGKNSIVAFFDRAKPVTQEFFGLIGDIFKLIFQPVATGDTSGLVGFLQKLRTEWLPALADLTGVIAGASTGVLGNLADEILRFVQVLTDNPETSGRLFQLLATNVVLFTEALSILNTILETEVGAKLAEFLFPLLIAGKIAASLGLLSPALSLLAGAIGALASGVAGYVALVGLGPALLTFAGVIAAVAAAVGLFILAWKNWDTIVEFVKGIPDLFNNALEALSGLPELLSNVDFDAIGDAILDGLKDLPKRLLEIGKDNLEAALDWLSEAAPKAAKFAGTVVGKVLGELLGLLPKLQALGVDLLSAAVGWILKLPTLMVRLLGLAVRTTVRVLTELPGIIVNILEGLLPLIGSVLQRLPALIAGKLVLLGTFLFNAVVAAIPAILEGAGVLIESVVNFFKALPGQLVEALKSFGTAVSEEFGASWEVIQDGANRLAENATNFFKDLPGKIVEALVGFASTVSDFFGEQWDGIKSGVDVLFDSAVEYFRTLPGKIVDALSAFSARVSAVFSTAWSVIVVGAESLGQSAVAWFRELPGRLVSALGLLAGLIRNVFRDAWDVVKTGAESLADSAIEFFKDLPRRLKNAIIGAAGILADAGREIVSKIISGIGEIGSQIRDKILSYVPGATAIKNAIGGSSLSLAGAAANIGGGGGNIAGSAIVPTPIGTSSYSDRGSSVSGASGGFGVSAESLLRIENATINEPVDVDMLADKIRAAIQFV